MKLFRMPIVLCSIALLASAAALQAKQQDLPEVTEDGLHRVPDSKLAIVYAEPGASLESYKRVQLLEPYVAFKKNWERDQRRTSATPLRLTSKDIERMKTTMATEFRDVFSSVLESGGYPVVDEAGDDVLLVRPAIINLDANAPDTMSAGMTTTYVASAGEMTLYVEIYDSVTGDLMAKALDRRVDNRNAHMYTWANSVTNKAASERILKGWASILLDALNEARQEAR